uniref:Peptidase dimerisation domain protein n=1 Tax=mine drainage metagenome TaxID=410659 RepID=E6QP47_9ZZZZ
MDACMELAADRARALGGRVRRHRQRRFGDLLELRFGSPRAATRTLLLGHLDTVWPLGTLRSMPCRVVDGRLRGPGALDMKVGVAMAFTAIEMLLESKSLTHAGSHEIILLLNSEEEIGSPVSRPVTEALAGECSAVYVLEPAQGLALKTSRKGTGNWRMEVTGRAAHAGVDFPEGRSAICELARLIEQVSEWTDLDRGLTVNVGVVGGGSKSNVIPAQAWAEVDVRIVRRADGPRIERRFAALKPTRSGKDCALAVTGGINRPPMERSRGVVRLFRRAQSLAAQLDWNLAEAATGGASDGNFTAALGIPTLDGLGAVGQGAHAVHEHVQIDSIAPRTALLAGLLAPETELA